MMMIVIRVSMTADSMVSYRVRETAPKIEMLLIMELASSREEHNAHAGMFCKLVSAMVQMNLNGTNVLNPIIESRTTSNAAHSCSVRTLTVYIQLNNQLKVVHAVLHPPPCSNFL